MENPGSHVFVDPWLLRQRGLPTPGSSGEGTPLFGDFGRAPSPRKACVVEEAADRAGPP